MSLLNANRTGGIYRGAAHDPTWNVDVIWTVTLEMGDSRTILQSIRNNRAATHTEMSN